MPVAVMVLAACQSSPAPQPPVEKQAPPPDARKPVVIEEPDLPGVLHELELRDLTGVARSMETRLHAAGIHSVDLANVILYSSLIGQTVELPMDSAAYEKKLNGLIAASKVEKKVVEVVGEDFTASFRK